MTSSLASTYVRLMHRMGKTPLFPRVGELAPSRREGNMRHWWASLPAIHDLDRMVALDTPWWTYKAIDEVTNFLNALPSARVFEWGSGASTIWLAKRSASVVSIEHDEKWHAFLNEKVRHTANVSTKLVEPVAEVSKGSVVSEKPGWTGQDFSEYARSILDFRGEFDLIVIDGRTRAACLENAVLKLSKGGIILFDNSRRKRYRQAINACGLQQLRLHGLTPSLPYVDETSLLTRPL